jgi:signal transduction histidine kinase
LRKSSVFNERRKALIQELQAAYRELDAARAKEGELAALRERERIARDMHDHLGHALVALSVQLEATQRLYKKDVERASAQMDQMKTLTRQSMDALRRSLAGLRAPGLGERPLRLALQETCASLSQRSGMSISCNVAPQSDAINPTVAESLWSVAQEALTNIEKHAQARRVEVRLDMDAAGLTLCIHDDGIGLPNEAYDRAGHFGLRGMRERIEGVGGTLSVDGNGEDGTRIVARVPVM